MKKQYSLWFYLALALVLTLVFFLSCMYAWLQQSQARHPAYFLSLVLALATGGAWVAYWFCTKLGATPKKSSAQKFEHSNENSFDASISTNQAYFWKFAMNSLPDYFYAKDLQGRYLGQNKALLDLFHHASEACVLGKSNTELYPNMDKEAIKKLEEIDLHAAHSPYPMIAEEYVPSKTGELMVCESVKCSYRDPNGMVIGMVCVSRDITSRKQIEEALLKSQTDAQAASQAKSAFLANTSHEIRTPLNGIIGMLHLALETELNEQQQDYLQKANESARHLLSVVNDILDFSKIEAGKMGLDLMPFSLHQTFSQVVEVCGLPATQAGVDVILTWDQNIPQQLIGDSMRIKQVLTNLLGNAVKFTHTGSITISCTLLETTPEGVYLQAAVQDTGIGIGEAQLTGLFESFSQGDVSRTRMYGGTGLGLAISKELVTLMGGDISVTSLQGKGTTFTFTLHLGLPCAEDIAKPIPTKSRPRLPLDKLKGIRVLLAEDNAINRIIASEILKKCQIIVDEAQNGMEAVEKVRQNTYDAVLMDIQMPLMDGLTATRCLREDPRFDNLPIIAMTAHAMRSDHEESRAAGMQEHVTKPLDPQELCEALMRWVKI